MYDVLGNDDYTDWDWLPGAASEIEDYLRRLLTEGAIVAHDVTARHKSIRSFQEKCQRKEYDDPRGQVTDCVAARVITYSVTDRDKVCELIRRRFELREDREPGREKPERRRGYDCVHLVATGEKSVAPSGWFVGGGDLARYLDRFGGLEIQVRTVAGHAWAEFEHHVRYKGAEYSALGDRDQLTIDRLFGAASDARRALDETFVAIEHILSNPAGASSAQPLADDSVPREASTEPRSGETQIDTATLREFLAGRFPDDAEATEAGLAFACQIAAACGVDSIEALSDVLDGVDGDQVRRLMATTTAVTRVRRLDDELLATYGEQYIANTGALGSGSWVEGRADKLRWRYDRLRRKVNIYGITGQDCPPEVRGVHMSAARTVREVARVVAERRGARTACIDGAISVHDDLPDSTRAREVGLADGSSIWVATNLNREASEEVLWDLLGRLGDADLHVTRSGSAWGPSRVDV